MCLNLTVWLANWSFFKSFVNKFKFLDINKLEKETPYGIVYKPNIWGAGWGIQNFGMKQYYLHTSYPDIISKKYMLNALNFILGVHPGVNTSSFASGVGARSLTQAYGINRGEFSFIPGGIGSGTALIRPDFPELLEWPFLWQQTEYVLGGGTTDYMFLVLAADQLLNEKLNKLLIKDEAKSSSEIDYIMEEENEDYEEEEID